MRVELTKRADYAIRTVLALARTPSDERRSVRWLASDQRVPVRFLPQVMADLVRAGLVEATVGRTGGYRLAKAAAEIPLLDVIEAVEGDSQRRVCVLRGGACAVEGVCDVHVVFASAHADVVRRLGATTVEASIRSTPH
jgi:Rrf2 family protein